MFEQQAVSHSSLGREGHSIYQNRSGITMNLTGSRILLSERCQSSCPLQTWLLQFNLDLILSQCGLDHPQGIQKVSINLKVVSLIYNVLQTSKTHTSIVGSHFNQLALPSQLRSSLCIHYQSHQTEPSAIGPSATQLKRWKTLLTSFRIGRRVSTHDV